MSYQGKTPQADEITIGDGTASDADIIADVSGTNPDPNLKPRIRYNQATATWQTSNDGSVFADIGSGGGSSPTEADLNQLAFSEMAIHPKQSTGVGTGNGPFLIGSPSSVLFLTHPTTTSGTLLRSTNGYNFPAGTHPGTPWQYTRGIYAQGKYFLLSTGSTTGPRIAVSTDDGVSWTKYSTFSDTAQHGSIHFDGTYFFIRIFTAISGTRIFRSTDPTLGAGSWSPVTEPAGAGTPTLSTANGRLFVCMSDNSTTSSIYYSVDSGTSFQLIETSTTRLHISGVEYLSGNYYIYSYTNTYNSTIILKSSNLSSVTVLQTLPSLGQAVAAGSGLQGTMGLLQITGLGAGNPKLVFFCPRQDRFVYAFDSLVGAAAGGQWSVGLGNFIYYFSTSVGPTAGISNTGYIQTV